VGGGGGHALSRAASVSGRGECALRLLRLAFAATALLTLATGLLLAVTVPFHSGDALAYGEWSRLIAMEWSIRFPAITDQTYHRPFFYVVQGVLWGVFGFHEWIGRLLALSFTVLLVAATAWLAARDSRRTTKAAVAACSASSRTCRRASRRG
jgi:4-amino-4-deoxy-L-arabinose transferase-like glycosyltransferase